MAIFSSYNSTEKNAYIRSRMKARATEVIRYSGWRFDSNGNLVKGYQVRGVSTDVMADGNVVAFSTYYSPAGNVCAFEKDGTFRWQTLCGDNSQAMNGVATDGSYVYVGGQPDASSQAVCYKISVSSGNVVDSAIETNTDAVINDIDVGATLLRFASSASAGNDVPYYADKSSMTMASVFVALDATNFMSVFAELDSDPLWPEFAITGSDHCQFDGCRFARYIKNDPLLWSFYVWHEDQGAVTGRGCWYDNSNMDSYVAAYSGLYKITRMYPDAIIGSPEWMNYSFRAEKVWSLGGIGQLHDVYGTADGSAIYCCGQAVPYEGGQASLWKISPSGDIIWGRYAGPTARRIYIDSSGDLYVAGSPGSVT